MCANSDAPWSVRQASEGSSLSPQWAVRGLAPENCTPRSRACAVSLSEKRFISNLNETKKKLVNAGEEEAGRRRGKKRENGREVYA